MKFADKQLSIKLKEKGFDRPCLGFYNPIQDELQLYCTNNKDVTYKNILTSVYKNKVLVDAPTIEQVLEWLREEKKIHIVIDFTDDMVWYFQIAKYYTKHYEYQQYGYNSYDDAILAGIEYVINNLI